MPPLRLPKYQEGEDLPRYLAEVVRELERWDQDSLRRETDLSLGLRVKDGRGGNFTYQQVKSKVAEVTLSGASVTIANFIEPGWLVYGAFTEVLTAISGATTWKFGTTLDDDAWGTGLALTKFSKTDFEDFTDRSIAIHVGAADAIITAQGSNFSGGVVRCVLWYADFKYP